MPTRTLLLLFSCLFATPAVCVELQSSVETSASGTFDLSWQGDEGERFRLLQLSDDGHRLIYQGPDTARVMTGLPDGRYRFQVEAASGVSQPVSVTVAHHSLGRAFGFFGIGLAVFLATLWLVVRGERGQH